MLPMAGRVIFRRTLALDVVLIVHMLGVLLRVLMGTHLVDLVHSLGLGQLVDLTSDEAHHGLFGEGMADGLACYSCIQHK